MARATRLTFDQVRELYRLLGDVRAVVDNPLVQRQMLADGACNLLGADQGFLSEFVDFMPGHTPREVQTVAGRQLDERATTFIQKFYATQAVEQDAMGAALFEAAAVPGATAISWNQARRHKPPARYGNFYDVLRTVRMTDIIDPMSRHPSGHMVALSLHRLGRAKPFDARERALAKLLAEELSLHRLGRAKPFDARERALAQLLAEELGWLHRTGRLNVHDLVGRPLAPRLRELLEHMLTDRSVKQIAHQMGLSLHTTRQYVAELYKHLGISGREELMVRFLPQPQRAS
jgi:DNA-binding CsgD family transcriptional regulator